MIGPRTIATIARPSRTAAVIRRQRGPAAPGASAVPRAGLDGVISAASGAWRVVDQAVFAPAIDDAVDKRAIVFAVAGHHGPTLRQEGWRALVHDRYV